MGITIAVASGVNHVYMVFMIFILLWCTMTYGYFTEAMSPPLHLGPDTKPKEWLLSSCRPAYLAFPNLPFTAWIQRLLPHFLGYVPYMYATNTRPTHAPHTSGIGHAHVFSVAVPYGQCSSTASSTTSATPNKARQILCTVRCLHTTFTHLHAHASVLVCSHCCGPTRRFHRCAYVIHIFSHRLG